MDGPPSLIQAQIINELYKEPATIEKLNEAFQGYSEDLIKSTIDYLINDCMVLRMKRSKPTYALTKRGLIQVYNAIKATE